MKFFYLVIFIFILLISPFSFAKKNLTPAITQPIPLSEMVEYQNCSHPICELFLKAFELSKMDLTYLYGSADPKNKGMDCSGTIYYLLTQNKLQNVPRQSDQLFAWAKEKGKLYPVNTDDLNSNQFSHLKPGDLLFWSGTYKIAREVTHVMIYLGKTTKGAPLMFGASDGRTYQGKKMWGVSVFDFQLPKRHTSARFLGYSCIPMLTCIQMKAKDRLKENT